MKIRLAILLVVLVSVSCVSSALAVPTPSATSSPPHPAVSLESKNDSYKVTATVLEVRAAPGELSDNIGYLQRGATVTVYETKETPSEVCRAWARIGIGKWVCMDRLERVE